jgi:PAS domain S-box-containing protein
VQAQGHSAPFEKEYQRPDGSRIPVRVSSAIVPGYPDRLIVFVSDITQERAAHTRERAIQQRLEIAISAANQGVWDFDLVTGEMIYSDRAKEIYGLQPDQPVTYELIRDATHPEDLPFTSAQFQRAIDPEIRDRSSYEYRIVRPDGSICWAHAFGEAIFEGPPGAEKAVRYAGTIQDITARKLAERQQTVLVAELNHRVKNMLATVQAIAFQTLRGEVPLGEARGRFEARLMALSRAHNLLTAENWIGASLERVVADATEHLSDGDRFDVSGEPLRLAPRAALALAMALHELGTNAAKYGALAAESGRVAIGWKVDGDRLRLEWRERGGPAVKPPNRRGFGSRLIERGLQADLGGAASLHFEPGGLRCEIEASLEAVRAAERALG